MQVSDDTLAFPKVVAGGRCDEGHVHGMVGDVGGTLAILPLAPRGYSQRVDCPPVGAAHRVLGAHQPEQPLRQGQGEGGIAVRQPTGRGCNNPSISM